VLGWLLAGVDALALSNADDATLVRRALDSLPSDLRAEARACFVEGKAHRWSGAVSGWPGGMPVRDPEHTHVIRDAGAPVFVVGDYLFDSTLNGVLRSARETAGLLQRWMAGARPPALAEGSPCGRTGTFTASASMTDADSG
jgi:hypothetical protein